MRLGRLRFFIHKVKDFFVLKLNAMNLNVTLGKGRCIRNAEYIIFEQNVRIKDGYRIECYDFFANKPLRPFLKIGKNCIIGYNFTALVADKMLIGENTIIASDVMITTENHGIDPETIVPYYAQPLKAEPVIIGKSNWIGEKVSILPGVTIGDKCIIAAGSVVTKDIPSFTIAAGVPARVIKKYDFVNHKWNSIIN